MDARQKVEKWLADDARQIRQAGPIEGLKVLRDMGGWSKMIRAYFKAAGAGEPAIDEIHSLRAWAMEQVADHRDAVLV